MTFDNPLLRRFGMIWAAAAVFQIPVVMLISPTGSLPLDVLKAVGFGLGVALLGGVVLLIGRKREDGAVMPAFILVAVVSFIMAYPVMKGGAYNGHFKASARPADAAAPRGRPGG
jgi:hypothetical protein